MLLHHSGQRQYQQRWQSLSDRRYVYQTLDRFQQTRHAKKFAFEQNLQPSKMQTQQDTQPCLEQVSAQQQAQANRLMLRLSSFTQRLQQQTAELLSMHSSDRALMAEQISQELSELHANLTTAAAALRYRSQQQTHQPPIQLVQDLADYIALSQTEVKNQLIELSLIRQARSRRVQQLLQSSGDRRLADMAELRTDLQNLCDDLRGLAPEIPQG